MARHKIHKTTTDAVNAELENGMTFRGLASFLGDMKLTGTLSDIHNNRNTTGRKMERRIRSGLGLDPHPPRKISKSQARMKELSAMLKSLGVTKLQAMEIAVRSLTTNDGGV